jgi:PAS domain S-box-containing protein
VSEKKASAPSPTVPPQTAAHLRQRAEEDGHAAEADPADPLSLDQAKQLLHELRVHQIELEMQNEELRRTQEALGASRGRYFELYDLAPVGYLTLSEAGVILEANLTVTTLLGVTRSALVKQPMTRFILNEDQDIYYRHRKQLLETGAPQACEMRMLRGDSAPFWVRLEAAAAQDADGAPVCHVVLSDITEHRRAEEALRESEERYRRITEAVTDYIYTVHVAEGRAVATRHGPGCVAVTGYASEEFAADPFLWQRMVVEADRPAVEYQARRLLAGESTPPLEHRLVRKDGQVRWVRNTPVLHLDPARELISYDGLIRDITERKQAEAERENLGTQLRQAQKMEAVGQLAGGVAHDFNNALTVILGFAELALLRLNPLDPLRQHMDQIVDAVRQSANLTRQLLTFARRQIVTPRVLDLNAAIASLAKMLPRLIGEDIDLRIAPGEAPWNVSIDPSQVDQIVINLVTNARDAIANTGTITVETGNVVLGEEHCRQHAGVAPGDYVVLTVSDTGVGMDKATMERIFDPFFTTKAEGKGTGLGLATVYGIAKQGGGFVDVYSEPGQGTTFKVYLPRFLGEAEQPMPKKEAGSLRGTETVLVVEDEPPLLDIIQKGLRELGYDVLAANSPGDAILLCEKDASEIRLLVTDVVMPTMNGKELRQRLERIKPGLRTIFMSGYTADIVTHRGIVAADILFVQKPFTIRALAEKIREALED